MLDACDLVLAFTKTSSHQEAVHILAGKILVVEINVHIRPVAEESVFTGSRHQNRTPGKLQSHILEMYRLWRNDVGTKVEVSHVSPSPVGMEITVTVEVTDISANGKMVDFKATATDTAGLIGEGTHQRAVITVDRFMDKCQAKLG